MLGIEFNGKHSYRDFGVTMAPGKVIGIPNKNKVKVTVPFSNAEYDFSSLYGGEQTYQPRPLVYPFNIYRKTIGKVPMNTMKTKFINWLMRNNGKQKLYDDAYPGYYFLAEIEGNSSFDEDYDTGILTVEFNAYPFMISELKEGHDIWDDFNFELDMAQPVNFVVNGSLEALLYNVGIPSLQPIITTSSSMEIIKDNIKYNIPSGISKSEDFTLDQGENDLIITGNGSISFEFHKELI